MLFVREVIKKFVEILVMLVMMITTITIISSMSVNPLSFARVFIGYMLLARTVHSCPDTP